MRIARFEQAGALPLREHGPRFLRLLRAPYAGDGVLVQLAEADETADGRYDPYGKVTITRGGTPQTTDPLGQHWTYAGRFHDEENGLHYYRARYYDPALGRFLQRDTLGYSAGPNLFEYALSTPTNTGTQRDGVHPWWFPGGLPWGPQALGHLVVGAQTAAAGLAGHVHPWWFPWGSQGPAQLGNGVQTTAAAGGRGRVYPWWFPGPWIDLGSRLRPWWQDRPPPTIGGGELRRNKLKRLLLVLKTVRVCIQRLNLALNPPQPPVPLIRPAGRGTRVTRGMLLGNLMALQRREKDILIVLNGPIEPSEEMLEDIEDESIHDTQNADILLNKIGR